MKYGDVQKLHEAGLITDEQRQKIIGHFQFKEDGGGRFLAIVSIVGAVLIAAGIALLVAAHWDGIPRGAKIAAGLLLMFGFHAGGWWLREVRGKYRKTGEALHWIGSCLFLANIALVGQIYNIVSRPPNAFLLWWIGIATLPWLLRSKSQHVLLLVAFGIWFGFEVNERGGLIYCESDRQVLLYALLGLVYLGAGYCLRATKFSEFAGVTEKSGLIVFLIFTYPLTWKGFFGWDNPEICRWFFPVFGLFAILWVVVGLKNLAALTRQWRWTWFAALLGMMVFMATVWFGCWRWDEGSGSHHYFWGESWSYLGGTLMLFVFCLLQIQVGIQEHSRFLVNLGVVFIALDILAAYCDLFGSMARTGVMFLISGIFLMVFGVYLEKETAWPDAPDENPAKGSGAMKFKLFILVVALQSAWLLGMIAVQEHALATGRVILLETARIDPRDLLRGDYLILNYKISDMPVNLFSPPVTKDLPDDTKIYVALAPGTNQFYVVVKASTNEFMPAAGEILLKGKSTWGQWNSPTNSIHIEYGLERFYVAEDTGNPTGKLTAQVVVPASGRGRVKEVFVDGKPYLEAMKDAVH